MATCPACDAEIEIDEFDIDRGDLLSCPECGESLEVTGVSPIELEIEDEEDETDDSDDEDEGEIADEDTGDDDEEDWDE